MSKRYVTGKCMIYGLIIFLMVFPVCYYAMLSVPFADDFSYSSAMRECLTHSSNPFFAAYQAMSNAYHNMGGEWFSNYMGYFLTQLEWNGMLGHRFSIFVLQIVFECSLLYLVSSFCSIYCKENLAIASSLGLFALFLYWVINNYCNTEVYTWYIVCAKYLLPLSIMCIGVGCYMRFLHRQRVYNWLIAMICGFLVNGSSLNISVLNCEFYCILMIYGIMRKQIKLKSVMASVIPLISLLIMMIAPGNFARYGSQDFYIGGCILGCLSAVLYRIAYLSLHTPFLVTIVLLFLWMIDHVQPQSNTKQVRRHPLLMLFLCFGCVMLVDGPYVMSLKIQTFGYVQYEDRGIFVQDFAIYLFAILWVLYLVLFIKEKFPDFKKKKQVNDSLRIGGIVLAGLIVLLNNPRELTTIRMWNSIQSGGATLYAHYQEKMIQQIEDSKQDVVELEYDTSIAPRKDMIILGLRLSEDENRWDYWYNNAVAGFYGKDRITVVYK